MIRNTWSIRDSWVIQDAWFAIRKFRQSPVLVLAALVTLVLGVGVNIAIFSLADGVCLRPLQIGDPSHLVAIESVKGTGGADAATGSSYAEYLDMQRQVPAFSGLAATSNRGVVLKTHDGLQMLMTRVVSDNYFELIGAQAELGRLPTEQESRAAQNATIVLAHRAWIEFFGGDKSVVGRSVDLNGATAIVAGVLPAGFRGTDRFAEPQCFVQESSWLTWAPGERSPNRATDRDFSLYARLAPGATLEQARGQLEAVARRLAVAYPQSNAGRNFTAEWNSADRRLRLLCALFLALAGAVLLIACANIANLILALNDSRRREMSLRIALGATRGRLLRQLITEYAVLAGMAVGGALWLAQWLVAMVPGLMPNIGFPVGLDLRIDHRVLAFTACITVLSILICGVVPGMSATRSSPLDAMRPPRSMAGKLKMPARKLFVIAQVAVSMALLVAAGLFVRTMLRMESADLGFKRAQRAVLFTIEVDRPTPQRLATFAALVDRMNALPGVTGASVGRVVPFALSGTGATRVVLAPGEAASPTAGTPVFFNQVDESFFRLMGVGLLQGRAIGRQDTPGSQRVVVINRTLARKLFGDGSAVGRHIRIGRDRPIDVEIVGVAADGKYNDVTEPSQPYLYLPVTQDPWAEGILIVTTAADPEALLPVARKAIRETDPSILIILGVTLKDHMRLATFAQLMEANITAGLGGLALLLSAVGLFGVVWYSVSRRTHEIGIRMALGAARGRVFRQVLNDGLKLVLIGMVLGLGLALLVGRAMSSLLYGIKPADPATLVFATGVMVFISILALIGPARRALRIEPLDALRED
ncbi:MAG: ADOP family duplicated permease [Terracidiphilus sp.]